MSSRVLRGGQQTSDAVPFKLDPIRSAMHSTSPREHVSVMEAPREAETISPTEIREESMAQREKSAYELGFREGQRSVGEAGEKALDAKLEQFSKNIEELRHLRRGILSTSEREVIHLALEIARKVVKREITIDEEIIITLVRVALKRVSDQTLITVRLNPMDYSVVKRHQSVGNAADILNEGIRLAEDPLISRGGCVIETESGLVDARIEEQFREIEKGFLD